MMTYQDAVCDLVRLWDLMPLLVGSPWRELEPSLLDAMEHLAAAETDDDRDQHAARVLRLCLPYAPLRRALEPAVRREVIRSGQGEAVSWTQTVHTVTTAIERSSRPGGDQWLVASLDEHATGEPMRAGRSYDLTIAIAGDDSAADAFASEPLSPQARQDPDAERTTLTVELFGNADIETVDPVLTLPRHGASPDRARFRVTPRAGSECLTLNAVVMRDGTFIQLLMMTTCIAEQVAAAPGVPSSARAGADVRVRALGRPMGEAFAADKPDATLLIAGQQILLTGYTAKSFKAQLSPSWQRLEEITNGPRVILQEIANGVLEAGPPAHQASVTIPQEVYEKYLPELVRAGTLMFRVLFFGSDATEELKDLGRALLGLMRDDGPLWLEIVADTPLIPWHLLAFQDPADQAAIDPSHILGLRHRISRPPMHTSGRRPPPSRRLRVDENPLRVVVAVNQDIDEHGGAPRDLVERQLTVWRQRARAGDGALVVTVVPEHQVLDVLVRSTPPGELIYLFCHSYLEADPTRLGPNSICLEFTGRHKVSLVDLVFHTPLDQEFDVAPLVVLNACASAVPAPSVYGSFLPYLLGRGARGVIGTEADIPPVFAAAWAQEFFTRVLDGAPLADAAFVVTRDFVRQHRNLLGLAYVLHCDGRSLVWPAIPREPLTLAAQS
jgi:hypothetical protein